MAGCISCFMTASLAGVLVEDAKYCDNSVESHCFNVAEYIEIMDNNFTSYANSSSSGQAFLPFREEL
uniref:Uncharacterized protein n=1 Tax=Panagrolaimus superbus TaxID=310955 RepID=A0A914YBW4_9BILA